MPKLFAFRGYRFDPEVVGPLDQVVTQPYDKISDSLRQEYLHRNPFNVAHLIANKNYRAAAKSLNDWISKGALLRDDKPCLYVYKQSYTWENQPLTRIGIIGLVSIQESEDSIKGHEKTMLEPLQDRLHLLRATETNDGLIFALYQEPKHFTDMLLEEIIEASPADVDVRDDFGFGHSLWKISDLRVQKSLNKVLGPLNFYIADGHHRFETAIQFMKECKEKGWRPKEVESFDKRMIALFNMESSGLRILPTHRAVRNLAQFDIKKLLVGLQKKFDVKSFPSLDSLRENLQSNPRTIGMLVGKSLRCWSIQPRKDSVAPPLKDLPKHSAGLDVNLLHLGILEPLLGIGAQELATQSNVDYFRDCKKLAQGIQNQTYQLGFLLSPTTLEQVRQCSDEKLMMPQKSTDFFPKLLTGLVFSKMGIMKTFV